jgi:hypothetical protein
MEPDDRLAPREGGHGRSEYPRHARHAEEIAPWFRRSRVSVSCTAAPCATLVWPRFLEDHVHLWRRDRSGRASAARMWSEN